MQLYRIPPPPSCLLLILDVAAVAFQQQSVCEIQLLQRFLYLFETPCKSPAEDADLGTVWVSQKPAEMPNIQHAAEAELGIM
ncbi:hypothetical protein TNCT_55631 [Trichonephila clavata]|uniref:Secreted protein n=1 Tax=Trichonephila clavata TaxID=2740835 RepID=A0A8X6FYB4_TRICU|nr:hypothetical protein TNCT_55631 [Trichonephila clavata]